MFAGFTGWSAESSPETAGSEPGIRHFRFRFAPDGIQWLGDTLTDGFLKPGGSAGSLVAEALRKDGSVISSARFSDPRVARFEFLEKPGGETLNAIVERVEEAEIVVRMADSPEMSQIRIRDTRAEATGVEVFDIPESGVLVADRPGKPGLATLPAGVQFSTILSNGPSANRVNVVFLGDGFRESDSLLFQARARAILDDLLAHPPFDGYPRHVNAFSIFVPSAENGSDHPSRREYRETYFQTSYDSSGIAHLVTISGLGRARADELLLQFTPGYDIPIMIVNDSEYGGSGGRILVTSSHTNSPQIARHEMGHSFAGLGDEYENPFPGYPILDEPNTTRETVRERIKWRTWILASTPVPTPKLQAYGSHVGLFEGARYQSKGWYRPKLDCLMRTVSESLCEVCREAMALKIHQLVRPVDEMEPPVNSPVAISAGGSGTFRIRILKPTVGNTQIEWRLNDVSFPAPGKDSQSVTAEMLKPGTNVVSVTVRHVSEWVRSDPMDFMKQELRWQVVPVDPPPPRLELVRNPDGSLGLLWVDAGVGNFYFLEETTVFDAAIWRRSEASPVREAAQWRVTIFPGDQNAYYRLRRDASR